MNLPITETGRRYLIAGAGGGFDVFCGVPIGIELQRNGSRVFFASYSFTRLDEVSGGEWITPDCLKVSHQASIKGNGYFPEKHLSAWLDSKGWENSDVYCFPHLGVKNLTDVYNHLAIALELDGLIVVDGGSDGIFRGDEYNLGTPSMDSISVIAGSQSTFTEKVYTFTAFGSEGVNKEVSHCEVLERVSDLTRRNAFLGVSNLVPQDPTVQEFDSCMEFTYRRMEARHYSNIVSSLRASWQGRFGDTSVTRKTETAPIWISPLTSIYWFFKLEEVARMKLFYDDVLESIDVPEVAEAIERYRGNRPKQKPIIPI